MGKGPIYIAGVSYSGKTQMRLMLSAHPNILITRHTYLWKQFLNRFGDLGNSDNFERCLAALTASRQAAMLAPDPERLRREFDQGEPTYARLFALLHRHHAERHGKSRWGDQSGGLEDDADLIFAHEPEAVILHMVRHPCERVEESLSSAGRRKGLVGWETGRWQRSAQLAGRNLKKYPHHYKVVQCEQLFAFPERVLWEVCQFIGEEFQPAMLSVPGLAEMGVQAGSSQNAVSIASDGNEPRRDEVREEKPFVKLSKLRVLRVFAVKNPITASAPPRLTPAERSFVQARAREEMSGLGYPASNPNLSLTERLACALADYPLNLAGSILFSSESEISRLRRKIGILRPC